MDPSICDRCGADFEPQAGTVSLPSYTVRTDAEGNGLTYQTESGNAYEFCPSCSKQVLDFFGHDDQVTG